MPGIGSRSDRLIVASNPPAVLWSARALEPSATQQVVETNDVLELGALRRGELPGHTLRCQFFDSGGQVNTRSREC